MRRTEPPKIRKTMPPGGLSLARPRASVAPASARSRHDEAPQSDLLVTAPQMLARASASLPVGPSSSSMPTAVATPPAAPPSPGVTVPPAARSSARSLPPVSAPAPRRGMTLPPVSTPPAKGLVPAPTLPPQRKPQDSLTETRELQIATIPITADSAEDQTSAWVGGVDPVSHGYEARSNEAQTFGTEPLPHVSNTAREEMELGTLDGIAQIQALEAIRLRGARAQEEEKKAEQSRQAGQKLAASLSNRPKRRETEAEAAPEPLAAAGLAVPRKVVSAPPPPPEPEPAASSMEVAISAPVAVPAPLVVSSKRQTSVERNLLELASDSNPALQQHQILQRQQAYNGATNGAANGAVYNGAAVSFPEPARSAPVMSPSPWASAQLPAIQTPLGHSAPRTVMVSAPGFDKKKYGLFAAYALLVAAIGVLGGVQLFGAKPEASAKVAQAQQQAQQAQQAPAQAVGAPGQPIALQSPVPGQPVSPAQQLPATQPQYPVYQQPAYGYTQPMQPAPIAQPPGQLPAGYVAAAPPYAGYAAPQPAPQPAPPARASCSGSCAGSTESGTCTGASTLLSATRTSQAEG
jgi:hypothetical protein